MPNYTSKEFLRRIHDPLDGKGPPPLSSEQQKQLADWRARNVQRKMLGRPTPESDQRPNFTTRPFSVLRPT